MTDNDKQSTGERIGVGGTPKPPYRLGKYELVEILGVGSLGTVYRGFDRQANAEVAVKLLQKASRQLQQGDEESERNAFFNEAHTTSLTHHPNVLRLLDAGIEGDFSFIAMELVEGATTLRDYVKPDALLPRERVINIIHKCAMALDHVHKRGILHRDIKPDNIMLTRDGEPKIGDFSVADSMEQQDGEETKQHIIGSPQYMSPEQLRGGELTPASDLFSMTIVAYELLCGRHPFAAGNVKELIRKLLLQPPTPITGHQADIPPELQAVIEQALQKKAAQRYTSGAEFAQALAEACGDLQHASEEISGESLYEAMRKLNFFSEFNDEELHTVAEKGLREDYKPGEEIMREGTVTESVYILVTGCVDVFKNDVLVDRLRGGSCFGELGYLTSIRRTATVLSTDEVCLFKLNAGVVESFPLSVQLKFSRAFIRVLVERLVQTTEVLTAR